METAYANRTNGNTGGDARSLAANAMIRQFWDNRKLRKRLEHDLEKAEDEALATSAKHVAATAEAAAVAGKRHAATVKAAAVAEVIRVNRQKRLEVNKRLEDDLEQAEDRMLAAIAKEVAATAEAYSVAAKAAAVAAKTAAQANMIRLSRQKRYEECLQNERDAADLRDALQSVLSVRQTHQDESAR